MSQHLVLSAATDYLTREEVATVVSRFSSLKSIKSIDFHIVPLHSEKLGYLSEQLLLTIQVKCTVGNRELAQSYTFFVKSSVANSSAFNSRVFREESHFYRDFLPRLRQFHVERWSPQCYLAKDNVLVLENLKSRGFHLAAGRLTASQLRAAVTAVARFHACSMLLERQLKVPLTEAFQGFFRAKSFERDDGRNSKWLRAGLELAECIARDLGLESEYIVTAYEEMTRGNRLTDGECNVICHQDLWINNLMFSIDDKLCRLLDFQMVVYAPFAIDIIQLLHLNLDGAMRTKLEQFAIKVYHSVLEQTLTLNGISIDQVVCLEKVLQAVQRQRLHGLFAAVQIGPLVFLNKRFARDYTKDPIHYQYYHFVNRKDFIRKVMQSDQGYRCRIEESVRELVVYVKRYGVR
ncbi:uncharacterized protein LOC131665720 [Phymastichus coffea]|uniref:uncharacterized protein LOC131665720 n=1 Tax=Phymastichus coffea TaxID=108790 RepID=UPI00273B3D49|nr:uncharacterized protein LOC131665720 [Phymastichus coffea]XP_058793763.1 uncharacterized protein LOC131665720 [Phymastichus coffea]XP_058793764.1 uncharacterized protein LOC131665720 [Phymastichus coffea]XP_058793765.1 uncharacterized protein LOC131665720 [Phymastichus coffea]XP_058793766.1 uncharacterized protein LOC131665720 [Phymastichus coffea]XP_058793767.1 uncharacterized protein LOC131665720 [Phymastichus coffea]XP_058793769.1 uncharacterized protein LOC131665720 [Phymastichus coffe